MRLRLTAFRAPQRIDVVDTAYDVTVRAADTGHLVTTVALQADADPHDSCPPSCPRTRSVSSGH
ncbi:hypothetical protein AB5J52_47655 [Streptomyces sp. R39]|uniref:Uncharacterized protein n=1 Tax=Streptomyces sp. R39 TaxID=3238631 RepID=A0AB39R424_9ACTN